VTGSYYTDVKNIALIVPVTASCSMAGTQLYAIGNAYDVSTRTYSHLETASADLLSATRSDVYKGQLVFTLPFTEQYHWVRIEVFIFTGSLHDSGPITSAIVGTAETVAADPNTRYVNYVGCTLDNTCNPIYNFCQSPNNNSTEQCVGYLYQNPNGCLELTIPDYSPYGMLSYQYYTLHNLPSSYPPIGSWVTVTGHSYRGNNFASNGNACPGNYINVDSITP
jgi:hypothetical protein